MPSVLIVDDDEPIRFLLGEFLRLHGCQCTLAASAAEAREHLQKKRFALVLSDLNMPGESGLHLLKYVFLNHPGTLGIMVSAIDDPEVIREVLKTGVYSYLVKPFALRELWVVVHRALNRGEGTE